jgi:hypothetical protein
MTRAFSPQAAVFAKWQIPRFGAEKGGRIAWIFADSRRIFFGGTRSQAKRKRILANVNQIDPPYRYSYEEYDFVRRTFGWN